MIIDISIHGQILSATADLLAEKSRQKHFCRLSTDAEWNGLTIKLIFRVVTGLTQISRTVLVTDPACIEVPPEMLCAGYLYIGAKGAGSEGNEVITTAIMRTPLKIWEAEAESAAPDSAATPPLADQVLAAIGIMVDLGTENKSSLVAAINEILVKIKNLQREDAVLGNALTELSDALTSLDAADIPAQLHYNGAADTVKAALEVLEGWIGNLQNLDTENKASLTEALNEVLQKCNGVPIADCVNNGYRGQGVYCAAGENLPDVQTSNHSSGRAHKGKGRQVVLIPDGENATQAPTLELNHGEAIPIHLRAGKAEANQDATKPVPAKALMRGVPYTLTFCGKYWLIDSSIDMMSSQLKQFEAKLTGTLESDEVSFPVVNAEDSQEAVFTVATITRSSEEIGQPGAGITLYSSGKVEEKLGQVENSVNTMINALNTALAGLVNAPASEEVQGNGA